MKNQYDGVNFMDQQVARDVLLEHLEHNIMAAPDDRSPADWVERAWEHVKSRRARKNISQTLLAALEHGTPRQRAYALRAIASGRRLAPPKELMRIARRRFHSHFRDKQVEGENLGMVFARVMANLPFSQLTKTDITFIQQLAYHPQLSRGVLAGLCRRTPDWVVQHSPELLTPELAENQLSIIVSRFKNNFDKLLALGQALQETPVFHTAWKAALHKHIKDNDTLQQLL